MPLDVNALYEALKPYGHSDVNMSYPYAPIRTGKPNLPLRVGVRLRLVDSESADEKTMHARLLANYHIVRDLLTQDFGLELESYPTFEIRGDLMRRYGMEPLATQVYAEATYDCWIN